jgi:integrase
MRIEDYPEVQTWLKTMGESSKPKHLAILEKFCEWCGKNPKELILMRDTELRNPDPNSRTGIRDLILDFRTYLEEQEYAPKSINSMDGYVRGFFTAVLGKAAMVNVKNYPAVTITKDLVPTLDELRLMIDAVNIEEKFRVIFMAQTGMRVSDALQLKIGDVQRGLDLGNSPLAITYTPIKDREMIGERITFLGSDGIEILKQYLKWREAQGEQLTENSPLFVGKCNQFKKVRMVRITSRAMIDTAKSAAKKAGIGNGNGKYGRMRTHCLRKFFITQLTNHGCEDKLVNFMSCHKLSEIDLVYWSRRVDELREIYRQRERYLNPISATSSKQTVEDIKSLSAKIEELENQIKLLTSGMVNGNAIAPNQKYESKIVASEEELVRLSNLGYECQQIGQEKWLMKQKINGTLTI